MILSRASLVFGLAAALLLPSAFANRVRSTNAPAAHHSAVSSSRRGHSSHRRAGKKAASKRHKLHGQQAIDANRVTQIQEALIREHYLSGAPSGDWDTTTQAAMQKFQDDNGWQTRLMPDSRALKKLGLGPDYSNALNAKDSSFAAPAPVSTIPAPEVHGFAAASGVNQ